MISGADQDSKKERGTNKKSDAADERVRPGVVVPPGLSNEGPACDTSNPTRTRQESECEVHAEN